MWIIKKKIVKRQWSWTEMFTPILETFLIQDDTREGSLQEVSWGRGDMSLKEFKQFVDEEIKKILIKRNSQ